MTATGKMICPKCGAAMNLHAEKIDYSVTPDEGNEFEVEMGGVLEDFYACPSCGNIEMRRCQMSDAGC